MTRPSHSDPLSYCRAEPCARCMSSAICRPDSPTLPNQKPEADRLRRDHKQGQLSTSPPCHRSSTGQCSCLNPPTPLAKHRMSPTIDFQREKRQLMEHRRMFGSNKNVPHQAVAELPQMSIRTPIRRMRPEQASSRSLDTHFLTSSLPLDFYSGFVPTNSACETQKAQSSCSAWTVAMWQLIQL